MKTLKISSGTPLPPSAVTETFGLLAQRGAGKTNAARVMAEEMSDAGLPFVAVDPVGSWWGLRAGRDGGAGLPIPIFGGKRGDVPLERGGGELIADLVVDQRLTCVLDLSTFDSESAKKEFLLHFARRLYQRNELPLHLFLEEADDYIPQRPMRDEVLLLRAWENIVRRGRSRGLGITLITQRSAAINKSVLTQVGTLIALRTTGPQDRGAIEEWLKHNAQSREILASLPSLANGEAWVWSPQFLGKTERVRFRLSRTEDSGATPTASKKVAAPATLADVDLGEIQRRMSATIERAKETDPKALRQKIAALERDLAAAKKAQPAPPAPKVERVEVPVVPDAMARRLEQVLAKIEKQHAAHQEEVTRLAVGLRRQLEQAIAAPKATVAPSVRSIAAHSRPAPKSRSVKENDALVARVAADGLTGPEQRVLDALAWWEAVDVSTPNKGQVGFIAGYRVGKSVGGTFGNVLGKLRSGGLIEYPDPGTVALTAEGRRTANAPVEEPTTAALHAAIRSRLDGPEWRVLAALIAAYPEQLTKHECGARSGYNVGDSVGGTFGNILGRLRGLGLIDYPKPGHVVAKPVLFLGSR